MNELLNAENLALTEQFSDAEIQLLMARLWELLAMQTGKYTACDSTSVTIEIAEELLASLWYTLTVAIEGMSIPYKRLLTDDLWSLITGGRKLISVKLERTKRLWETVCTTAPDIQNCYYLATLRSIGVYLKRYDIYYFAHHLPANIDYPLICPPSETLQGISYTEEYLKCVLVENLLLRHFDSVAVRQVLKQVTTDYEDFFLNLCEQPLINALALTILEKPARCLALTDDDRQQLMRKLLGADKAAMQERFYAAADALRCEFRLANNFTKVYLRSLIDGLLPRLENALAAGNILAVIV